jgi:hypothetical protein
MKIEREKCGYFVKIVVKPIISSPKFSPKFNIKFSKTQLDKAKPLSQSG